VRVVHFVGFRGDEFNRAKRVFLKEGDAHFVHPGWDLRAAREIAEDDLVIFAEGTSDQEPRRRSFADFVETADPALRDRS
jgi:hypothetical protein